MLLHKKYVKVHEEIEEFLLFQGSAMLFQSKALILQCTEAIKEATNSQKHASSFGQKSFYLYQ